ncbi:MAG: hypothetical protein FWJ73_05290 [Limnochordales bacterium]
MIRFVSWTRRQLAASLALFCLGVLLGALGATLRHGSRLEALSVDNERLRDRLADLEERYERLQQQPASRLLAKDVVVELVDFEGDERTALQLRRFVRDLVLDHVIGAPVNEIDHLLMQKLVHDRHVTVENREWRVQVVMSSITWETFFLYVKASPASGP